MGLFDFFRLRKTKHDSCADSASGADSSSSNDRARGVCDTPLNANYTPEAHETRAAHHETPIKIIGVGSGGVSFVERMVDDPCGFVEYAIISDDATAIRTSKVSHKLQLQKSASGTEKSINTQEEFDSYYASQKENVSLIRSIIEDSVGPLIIVSGFGGGFGTYCSEWIATLAKRANIPVGVVCTIPFDFEGQTKQERALNAVKDLEESGVPVKVLFAEDINEMYTDTLIPECYTLLEGYVAEAVHKLCNEMVPRAGGTRNSDVAKK